MCTLLLHTQRVMVPLNSLNQTVKAKLKKHCHDFPLHWPQYIPQIRQAYMNSKHSATGFSPNEMLYGFAPCLPLAVRDALLAAMNLEAAKHAGDLRDRKEFIEQKAFLALRKRQYQGMQLRNGRNTVEPDLQIGDHVMEIKLPKSALHTSMDGPYLVVQLDANISHAILETGGDCCAPTSALPTTHQPP